MPLYKEKSLIASPSDDESCINEFGVKARPPLHPLKQERVLISQPNENTLIQQFTSSGKGISKMIEASLDTMNPTLSSAAVNDDLMSTLVDKIVEKNLIEVDRSGNTTLEATLDSSNKTNNYF